MKMLLVSIIASVISFMPTYAAADIKVSGEDGVFIGYLAGDGWFDGKPSIRLFLPELQRFVTYVEKYTVYNLRTIPSTYYKEEFCGGDAYFRDPYSPFDEILRLEGTNLTYAGTGDKTTVYYESRRTGYFCINAIGNFIGRKAVPIQTGTVLLDLSGKIPLKFEQVNNVVVLPYRSR